MKSLYLNNNIQRPSQARAISSGNNSIDLALPLGGWKTQVINELVSNEQQINPLKVLGPTLATLSQQGRWIVLIGAQKNEIKQLLSEYGIASNKVLLVHPKDQIDALWAMEQALMSGTSSAVLGWPGAIDERDIRRLQIAAKRSQALAFVFKQASCHTTDQSCQQLSLNKIKYFIH
ncbi:MAG: cell division protein [Gammaproteobacteria bacterium]|nr:cell division protein [Gammaproteobacteria bacterium]